MELKSDPHIIMMFTFCFSFYFDLDALVAVQLFQYWKKLMNQMKKLLSIFGFHCVLTRILEGSLCIE